MAAADVDRQIDLLARRERPRLVAALIARIGYDNLELAEDVAQDALIKAISRWPYTGLPENPAAWLQRVSLNAAIDEIRRRKRQEPLADAARDGATDVFLERISDPELRLIFLCCNPRIPERDQLALTLQVASGFTACEIGTLLLRSEAQVSQRLARLKRKLRLLGDELTDAPSVTDLADRHSVVVQVVYLMFALGFGPRSGRDVIRRDVAEEAIRLAVELANCETTTSPSAHALAAMLCLHGSRLTARTSPAGDLVLLENQNRGAWNRSLIALGLYHLARSQHGDELCALHLEAGIAACHATAISWEETDWATINWYYDELARRFPSPIVQLNRAVAMTLSGRQDRGEAMLEAIGDDERLRNYAPFFIARAEIRKRLGKTAASDEDYRRALTLDVSAPTAERLRQRMAGAQILG